MNYDINDIFNPKFLQNVQMISQIQQTDHKPQPEEILKLLHALDDFCEAYKDVAPENKMQAQNACLVKVLSEIKNGSLN